MNLIRETWAADRRPCLVLAAATRALPSAVLGPVLLPPCIRQRFLSLMAGFWQGVPLRVLARQRWPGQLGPSRVLGFEKIGWFGIMHLTSVKV